MAKKKRVNPALPALAAAASAIPLLAPAVSAFSPIDIAFAATRDHAALQAIAQAVARGDDVMTPEHLRALILAKRRDFTLIDIRSPDAYAKGHIAGAESIPLPKLFAEDEIVRLRRLPQVIVYAETTDQEAQAAVLLRVAGVPALALAGGLEAWAHELSAEAKQKRTAATVRALNACPPLAPAVIPALTTGPAAAPAQAPAAAPAAPKTYPPLKLKGTCG